VTDGLIEERAIPFDDNLKNSSWPLRRPIEALRRRDVH
jgi:hypothetical protein